MGFAGASYAGGILDLCLMLRGGQSSRDGPAADGGVVGDGECPERW